MALEAVLLDIDGTLVLSNDTHAEAWVRAFRAHGYDLPFERVRPLIGMGADKLIPTLVPGLRADEGEGKAIADERKAIFLRDYAPTLQPAPGARPLVERMRRDGLRLVVATSAQQDEVQALLQAAQVADLLDTYTTSSDAGSSKPAPDIVAVALKKAGSLPDATLMLGDTPYDIESASKVGVGTIALLCGGFPREQLAAALAIYADPADLLAHYDDSPLARRAHASARPG